MTKEVFIKNLSQDDLKEYCKLQIKINRADKLCVDRIGDEFEAYRKSYYINRDIDFEDTILRYLENLDFFKPWQYKFYCWLCKIKNIEPRVNKPFDDFSYIVTNERSFIKKYVYNETRIALFKELEKLFLLFKENNIFEFKKLDIIVGGSFVSEKESPTDIDFAICVSQKLFLSKPEHNDSNYIRNCFNISNQLDFKIFPQNFDANNYYIYGWLVNLSNLAKHKEKTKEILQNNEFKKINLLKFSKKL